MEKKMEPATVKSSIPQEIFFEIFSRLPVESLMRFKCVSKFWDSLISESAFADMHQRRMRGIKFIVRQREKLYTMEAMEEGEVSPLHIENFGEKLFYNHVMCVNGLFCCSMEHVERVTICNPTTKVVRSLPRLKEFAKIDYPEYFYSMGSDREKKTYKVLMTVNDYLRSASTRNWVFTFGTDKSWREIKGITDFAVIGKNAVYISGVIYMLSNYGDGNPFIVAFDVKTENFRIITLWNSSDHNEYSYYNIIKANGKLAILDKNVYLNGGDDMDLWILGKEGWEKHFIQIPQQWESSEYKQTTLCSSCYGEISFTKRFEDELHSQLICFCYDVTKKSWRKFEIQGLPEQSLINGIYCYSRSFFPVENICKCT